MTKLVHISDTHIKLLTDHHYYRAIFDKLYAKLRDEKPDAIIHCGDLFHNKTSLTPEAIQMAGDFLANLADIAPTYIIAGNHDLNLKNDNRLDSISPVVDFLKHPQLHYIKKAQEIEIGNNIVLNALVINDVDNWKKISDTTKINIALYHGSISGVKTDTGYIMEHGDHDISIFEGFDYGLLGDIHLTNQVVDTESRLRFCGSTIQQNFGESNNKGFLIWEIQDKNTFDVRHISIPHPAPYITIQLEPDGSIPEDCTVMPGSRLRLVSNNNISLQALKKSIDIAKTRFSPASVIIQNKPGKRIDVEDFTDSIQQENLRDISTQEGIINEYLKDYKLNNEVLAKVHELNRKYNSLAEQSEEVARNIHWKLKSIQWNNLFNYGENNSINFQNLSGVVGVLGKNFSGKTSLVEAGLWGIFNNISKNVRKNVDIINQNKDEANTVVEIEANNKIYRISRDAKKYTKKLHGEQTVEAKTNVDFSCTDLTSGETNSLNGLDRNETDANIRHVFGTLDDFLLTSMSSQNGSLAFINEGSTKRKEILGKFLDLELFEKKFRLAKDDSALLKGAIKRLEGKDFDSEISKTLTDIIDNEILTERNREKCQLLRKELFELQNELADLRAKIKAGPKQDFIDLSKVLKEISIKDGEHKSLISRQEDLVRDLEKREDVLAQLKSALSKYDYEQLKNDKKALEELNKQALLVESAIQMLQKQKKDQQKQISILDNVPCGNQFLSCRFLVDAAKQRETFPETEKKLLENEELLKQVEDKISKDETQKHLNKFQELNNNLLILDKEISSLKLKIEKNKGEISICMQKLAELYALQKTYHDNEAWMKQLHNFKQEQQEIDKKAALAQMTLEACESDTGKLHREHGSLLNKKETLENEKAELAKLRDEFLAYDLYQKSMHSNGIVYDVIKKRLPVINQEIAKILTNIVNFEVFFEDDGKKLDIYIRHPKYESRPIESGSGAEKSIAAIAIRLALIKLTTLPVSDIMILDEPATSLDEENMEGFIKILEMIKGQFKTVILISHLDVLKDTIDQQIIINKIDGFANVNI